MPPSFMNVQTSADGKISRRSLLRQLSLGTAAAGAASFGLRDVLSAKAAELRRLGKSMILLWMDGGPSQFETFNPKIGSKYQGPDGAINTTLPGIQFAQHWPKTAQMMDHIALIRSMQSNERDHFRAIQLVKTGYPPNPSLAHPIWGAVVARDRWDPDFDLPAFIRIGKPRIKTRDVGAGILAPRFESFKIDSPGRVPDNVLPTVSPDVLRRRLALADQIDQSYARNGGETVVGEKHEIYDRTSRFVTSPKLKAFDLSSESDKLRDSYGRTEFGQGCLLARRLVEQGVSFVEVFSTGGLNDQGWDTHKRGFKENPPLAHETDPAYATLLDDLRVRGMLDDTLVVWMGEFGRTPKFKPKGDGGREHYSEGWVTCLSGGGIRTGQVIGSTDKDGVKITDRPVSVQDLLMTCSKVLGIDPDDEYVSAENQPLKVVDGGSVIEELF